jgi:hypothetical protein
VRLKELSQVVLGGRRELVRLQNPEALAGLGAATDSANSEAFAPVNRARRAAGRLRRAASRGLAS